MDREELGQTIRRNLANVRQRIAGAAAASGRDPANVKLVAVTKYAEPEWVRELMQIHTVFGESRPQQLVARAAELESDIEWHLIGQLQRNKVRSVLPVCHTIHSVDSWKLLERIDRIAGELGLSPRVLLEVNVSGETAKSGFAPSDLRSGLDQLSDYARVQVAGLMTMAPASPDPEDSRACFRSLRKLRDELSVSERPLAELSMGMSGDFEIAVSEGATIVRVGSRLFEDLGYRA